MEKTGFKVIEGSLLIDPQEACGVFVSAEATETRLMGVVGVHVERDRSGTPFHQFFYIDTEEYGLDDYQSLMDPTPEAVEKKKAELFGALGGVWKSITEKESLFLVRYYAQINKRQNLPLPEGIDEYAAILETDFSVSAKEKAALWEKICVKTHNDYELINYFIMRLVARDNDLLVYLSLPGSSIAPINTKSPGTLLRNEVIKSDSYDDSSSKHVYTCISLMDLEKTYQLAESEITVSEGKVTGFSVRSSMPISTWEASLILNRPEYIIHGTVEGNTEGFKETVFSVFSTVTESSYDFGSLFMVFRKNNGHVKKKVYRLDHDTLGIVCLLTNNEIIFAGSDPTEIEAIEMSIATAIAVNGMRLKTIGGYKFPEPTLVRFVDSDFDSFKDFLDYLQSFQE